MYSVIKRLEQAENNEYLFAFSLPVENSIYTIYHEAKISADSASKLLIAMQKDTSEDLLDLDYKVYISVASNALCQILVNFDGFFLSSPDPKSMNNGLIPYLVTKKANGIYSILLKNAINRESLEFITSEAVYSTMQKLLGISEGESMSDICFHFNKPEECTEINLSYYLSIPLKDTSLKAYFTKN